MEPVPVTADEPKQHSERPLPPLRYRILTLLALSLSAGAGTAIWLERASYERFPGFLQARLRTVSAARDCEIAETLVASGAVVTAGQPLVRLKDADFEQRFDEKKAEVESLEVELAQNEGRLEVELEWRRKDLLERIFEAKLRLAEAERHDRQLPFGTDLFRGTGWDAVPSGEREPRRLGGNSPIEQAALSQTEEAPASGSVPTSQVELCKQHIQELERINRELPAKISRSMGVDLARTKLAHARAELARMESQKRELTVVAEASGLVGVFLKQPGEHVAAHEPIVQLLDEEQPYLVLQVPSPRIADFAPGTVVDLCFPGGKRGKGRVQEIPPQTSPIPGENSPAAETVITAHVDPVGALWPNLPFGSAVEVRRRR